MATGYKDQIKTFLEANYAEQFKVEETDEGVSVSWEKDGRRYRTTLSHAEMRAYTAEGKDLNHLIQMRLWNLGLPLKEGGD